LLRYISEPEKLKGLIRVGSPDVIDIDEALELFEIVCEYQNKVSLDFLKSGK
jgi:hypothetical protein